jgi:hypothetical protein
MSHSALVDSQQLQVMMMQTMMQYQTCIQENARMDCFPLILFPLLYSTVLIQVAQSLYIWMTRTLYYIGHCHFVFL